MTDKEEELAVETLISLLENSRKLEEYFYKACDTISRYRDYISAFEARKDKVKEFNEEYMYSSTLFNYKGRLESICINGKKYKLQDLYKTVRELKVKRKQLNSEWDKAKKLYWDSIEKYAKFYGKMCHEMDDLVYRYYKNHRRIQDKKIEIAALKDKLTLLESELNSMLKR